MNTNQNLQLIMTTYPGFHDLPKGVRKMLLVSESFFFEESQRKPESHTVTAPVPALPVETRSGMAERVEA